MTYLIDKPTFGDQVFVWVNNGRSLFFFKYWYGLNIWLNFTKTGLSGCLTFHGPPLYNEGHPLRPAGIISKTCLHGALTISDWMDNKEIYTWAIGLSSAPMAVSRMDNGCFTAVNKAFLQFTGLTMQEAVGRSAFDLGFWTDPNDRRKYFEVIERGASINNLEMTISRKKDGTRIVLWSAAPLDSKSSNLLVNTWTDITEYKEAEQAVRKIEDKYHRIIENDWEGVFIIQDWSYKYVNRSGADILGISPRQAIDAHLFDFVHPEDKGLVMKRLIDQFGGLPVDDLMEHRIIDARGGVKWVETRGVLTDWNGQPALVNFVTDVTAQKENGKRALGKRLSPPIHCQRQLRVHLGQGSSRRLSPG